MPTFNIEKTTTLWSENSQTLMSPKKFFTKLKRKYQRHVLRKCQGLENTNVIIWEHTNVMVL